MDQSQYSMGRWVLAIMIASIVLWAVMIFGTLAYLRQLAGGLDPFDVRPLGYGTAQARALLEALGDAGRDFYANVQLRLDTIYPATYALSRASVVWWLTAPGRLRGAPIPTAMRFLLLVPSAATAGFDYAENFQIGKMLAAGPGVDASVIETASKMTLLKSLVGGANDTGIIALVAVAAVRWRRGQQR